jgi:DNA polymerase elongation subunit (family B)
VENISYLVAQKKRTERLQYKEQQPEMILQPIDWHEHDVHGAYVIDVFGRCEDKKVVCVRLTGFRPYFFTSEKPDIFAVYEASNKMLLKCGAKWCKSKGIYENPHPVATQVKKYDTMAGFNDIKHANVWKVEFQTLASFKAARGNVRDADGKQNDQHREPLLKGVQYESNLPPFLRFFHEKHLGPASPLKCTKASEMDIPENEDGEPLYYVDAFYSCHYTNVETCDANIPLLVASYDLEMCPAGESNQFPVASKDPIIQIGVSYRRSTDMITPTARVVFVLGEVADSGDSSVEFVSCDTEADMLLQFAEEIRTRNPDILCGYNIFGFDDAYIEGRVKALGIEQDFEVSRKKTSDWGETKFATQKTELAAGKFDLRYFTLRGRLGIDLLLNMRREHNLDNFKLDNVAFTFLRDKVISYADKFVTTKSTRGLRIGNYVRFELVGNTNDPVYDGEKFEVWDVSSKGFRIRCDRDLFAEFTPEQMKHLEWSFSKDDVSPQEMFELHRRGGPEGRARVARYCIQDCDLVATLMGKLDTIVNARGMADVCKVPMQFVLTRGQGIKIFSAVVYYASQRDQIIQTQEAAGGEGIGYEGAIVLPPKIGMYLDQPVSVLDFNSLYPTNMIAYNLSPDTWVATRMVDDEGFTVQRCGLKKDEIEALEAKGYVFEEIDYDNKEEGGKTVCTFVQANDNPMTQGVLPKTLEILLKKRKEFKQKMEDLQYDESQRSVFNGLQLAYKVVANSVYGQSGARTSPIRNVYVAACTTAAGRRALQFARSIAETEFGGDVVYGDTDSIFVKFPTKSVSESIRMGIDCGVSISKQMRRPYKIAYEKTFYPFILFCRKRYVGMKYEEDPSPAKAKRMTMGVVLKRRDNAPIVKDVFGGALDILLQERDIRKAQGFVKDMLVKILENKLPLEKFILSKSLRDDYVTVVPEDIRKHKSPGKHPDLNGDKASFHKVKDYAVEFGLTMPDSSLAHRKLADRMETRDPGTAPKVGDRVQFVYVAENKDKAKQGDRIEHVDYVRSQKMKPDVNFYVTNQIQNPVAQLFALCIEELDGYLPPTKESYSAMYARFMEKLKDEEEAMLAVLDKKADQLDKLMFLGSPLLSKMVKAAVRGPMDAFFRK